MTENQEEDKSNKTFLWWFLRVVGILIISAMVVALITFPLKKKLYTKADWGPLADPFELGNKPFLAWIILSLVMIGILYGTNN